MAGLERLTAGFDCCTHGGLFHTHAPDLEVNALITLEGKEITLGTIGLDSD